jgi:hypothetical protein
VPTVKLVGLTDTLRVVADPLARLAESHGQLGFGEGHIMYVNWEVLTVMFWGAGATTVADVAWYANVSDDGITVNEPGTTVKLAVTCGAVPLPPVRVNVQLYTWGVSPAVFTVAVNVAGVTALLELMPSQEQPFPGTTLKLKTLLAELLVTDTI